MTRSLPLSHWHGDLSLKLSFQYFLDITTKMSEPTAGGDSGKKPDHTTGAGGNKKSNYKGYRAHNKPMNESRFKGRETEMDGHIYDCSGYKQADTCTRTTSEIAEFVG